MGAASRGATWVEAMPPLAPDDRSLTATRRLNYPESSLPVLAVLTECLESLYTNPHIVHTYYLHVFDQKPKKFE